VDAQSFLRTGNKPLFCHQYLPIGCTTFSDKMNYRGRLKTETLSAQQLSTMFMFFSKAQSLNCRLWEPFSLLSNGYRGSYPLRKSGQSVKLTTHLNAVPRLRIRGDIPPLPHTCSWHGALLSTGTTLPFTLRRMRHLAVRDESKSSSPCVSTLINLT